MSEICHTNDIMVPEVLETYQKKRVAVLEDDQSRSLNLPKHLVGSVKEVIQR